jgi:hypothetical protein
MPWGEKTRPPEFFAGVNKNFTNVGFYYIHFIPLLKHPTFIGQKFKIRGHESGNREFF